MVCGVWKAFNGADSCYRCKINGVWGVGKHLMFLTLVITVIFLDGAGKHLIFLTLAITVIFVDGVGSIQCS